MKTLYLIFALCGIWMSVDGAILECLVKIEQEEPSLMSDLTDLVNTSKHILNQIDNNLDLQNLQESLNTEIGNICHPAELKEKLYPLAMRVLKVCVNRENILTEKGRQMAESILKHSFCEIFMKLAVIGKSIFRDECFNNESITRGMLRCSIGSINALNMFSSQNTEMCTAQSKTSACIKQLMKGKCSDITSILMNILLSGVRNIFGCASDANITAISNSSGMSSVSQISKLDSKLRGNSSTLNLKENCKSKIQNDEDIFRGISNLKDTLRNGLENITENLSQRNYKQSLDSMVNDVCLPAISDDNLYSLIMRVFRICISQEDIFTEEGKQMFKSIVKRSFCNIPMKFAALRTFVPHDDCYPKPGLTIFMCLLLKTAPAPRYKFPHDNFVCRELASRVDCLNGAVNSMCPASVFEKTEFFLVEMLNFISDCDFTIEPLETIRSSEFIKFKPAQ